MLKNKKKLLAVFVLISFFGVIGYQFLPKEYAGIVWPKSSVIEFSTDEDLVITLKEEFETYNGKWPKETSFFISKNKIREVEAFDDFEFFFFKFKKGAIIALKEGDEGIHEMFITAPIKIDGLDLHEECVIEFKSGVLFSARCPELEKVFFKRFIRPETLEYGI